MRAFSPIVRLPSEWISPSIFPSTTRSLVNFTMHLISTSELSTLRPMPVDGRWEAGWEPEWEVGSGGAECGSKRTGSGWRAGAGPDSTGCWPITFLNTVGIEFGGMDKSNGNPRRDGLIEGLCRCQRELPGLDLWAEWEELRAGSVPGRRVPPRRAA